MSWNVCTFEDCEAYTARPDGQWCESHRRLILKQEQDEKKATEKRKALLLKPMKLRADITQPIYKMAKIKKVSNKLEKLRKGISKNPKDWTNTFLCSDGTRVTQDQIDRRLRSAYKAKYPPHIYFLCEGCGKPCQRSHAHIISQARCKQIGKTELIWHKDNFFRADHECNAAIENPKGKAWRKLKNIDHCIQFIYEHDKELFFKFEAQGWSRLSLKEPTV